jgi:hypothetical protein
MKTLMKLAVPLGLGIVATVLNFMAGQSAKAPVAFLVAGTDITAGSAFTTDNTQKVELPNDQAGTLKGVVVPASERAVVLGRICPRNLKKGDVIFYRDVSPTEPDLDLRKDEELYFLSLEGLVTNSLPALLKVGDEIGFWVYPRPAAEGGKAAKADPEYVGPFRVVSLGKRITRDGVDKGGQGSGDMREIGFAIKTSGDHKKLDENIKRLSEARAATPGATSCQVIVVIHALRHKK